jgi:hypothetical protein
MTINVKGMGFDETCAFVATLDVATQRTRFVRPSPCFMDANYPIQEIFYFNFISFEVYTACIITCPLLILYKRRIHDSSIRVEAGCVLNCRGSIPDAGKGCFSSPLCPKRIWGPPSLIYNEHRGLFLQEQSGRVVNDHLPPSSAHTYSYAVIN